MYLHIAGLTKKWPINNCDSNLENLPFTHIRGFREIQIWNIQIIIASLCSNNYSFLMLDGSHIRCALEVD